MRYLIQKIIVIVILLGCSSTLLSQNFNYTLQKDSVVYSSLTGSQVLSAGQSWRNKVFGIHLPFQFNFCGSQTDTLIIEGNGFVVFDNIKGLALVAFNNFGSNKDTAQNYQSSISCAISGSQGNRIMSIEFKNLSQNLFSLNDNLSYQIWLYENGNKIEFHIGGNSYSNIEGSEMPVLIGAINKNMDTENKAYLITGNPANPTGQLISGDAEFMYLNNVPSEGIVLKLIPTIN